MVKRLNPLGVICFIGDFLENFNLIIGGLKIMGRTFHDFNSNVVPVLEIFSEPNCRKVAPAQFLHQDVSVDEDLANMAGVVAADFVVFNALVLTVVFLIKV